MKPVATDQADLRACFLCGVELTPEANSDEHILVNALGGRLKASGLICRPCNSETGASWDAALSAQFAQLAHWCGIKRERGVLPSVRVTTTTGQQLNYRRDGVLIPGRPDVRETIRGDAVELAVQARDRDELRGILEGFARKYPGRIDVDQLVDGAMPAWSAPEGMLKLQLNPEGPDAERSIVKSAVGFARLRGMPKAEGEAVRFLRDAEAERCIGSWYRSDLLINRPQGVPLHCVAAAGNPETGIALGYVEYFGVSRSLVGLDMNYAGPAFSGVHAIDPRSGSSVDVEIDLELDRAAYADARTGDAADPEDARSAVGPILYGMYLQRQTDERARVVGEAVDRAFKQCGAKEGEELTEEHLARLSTTVAKFVAPWILSKR